MLAPLSGGLTAPGLFARRPPGEPEKTVGLPYRETDKISGRVAAVLDFGRMLPRDRRAEVIRDSKRDPAAGGSQQIPPRPGSASPEPPSRSPGKVGALLWLLRSRDDMGLMCLRATGGAVFEAAAA